MIVQDGAGAGTPIQVAVVLAQPRPTGLVRQLLEALGRMEPHRIKTCLFCIVRRGTDSSALSLLAKKHGVECEFLIEDGRVDVKPFKALAASLRKRKFDIVQTHGYKPSLYGFLVNKYLNLPWIAFYHGRTSTDWKVRAYHQLDRWLMSHATVLVSVANGVESHFLPVDRHRIRVVPNGVIPMSAPTRIRAEILRGLSIPIGVVVVGFVGRLSHEKGPDLFLEAFARYKLTHPSSVALVVGDGPMLSELRSRASRLGIDRSVLFVGQVDRVSDMYEAMDVLVISSRSEVFPNVLLEAVEMELPVVATKVGGIPAVANGLRTVTLADAQMPDSMAGALEQAVDSATVYDCAVSRDLIRRTFSQERRVSVMVALYRELATNR